MKIDVTKKILGVALLCMFFFLAGCGVFEGEQTMEQMDAPPEDAEMTDDLENVPGEETDEAEENAAEEGETEGEGDTEGEESTDAGQTVTRVLYLMDQSGLVVPQEVDLPAPQSKEVAKQVLEYLVKDGPVSSMLPNGFEAVLPAGTEIIDLNLESDGTIVVNVSEDFKTYQAEDEQKILESMTYTLTQFENVKRVKLWINGEEQAEMPVNGTPISEGYSRANGINVLQAKGIDLMESKATTLYFPMQGDNEVYYVPITQHVSVDKDNQFQSVVQALLNGPAYELNMQPYINTGSQLAAEPVMEDGVLSLTFNESILSNSEKSVIADEVMKSIVLTLTEQEGIDAVNVSIENHEEVMGENGQPYTEPVSRDMVTPTESI
ncbi:GerMN domain-containing protein [Gracilibacillus salinarum]|uniref:GerMN domain-containing protein n=1 Tax=Gracilibacillus salinarum TaxID=2932255 RepID=A0ABY4GPG0_9BACI|nr:GerMN domain-containing protein [Gracilibacillus salinarum]UOQ86217.1 GerMN domain-containing protein [Gracilibacillus salinarum]